MVKFIESAVEKIKLHKFKEYNKCSKPTTKLPKFNLKFKDYNIYNKPTT